MNLANPPPQYNQADEAKTRADISTADRENIKRDTIIQRWVMVSPNGAKYYFTVSNAGAAVFTAV